MKNETILDQMVTHTKTNKPVNLALDFSVVELAQLSQAAGNSGLTVEELIVRMIRDNCIVDLMANSYQLPA